MQSLPIPLRGTAKEEVRSTLWVILAWLSFAYTPIPLYPYAPSVHGVIAEGKGVIAEGEGVILSSISEGEGTNLSFAIR